MRDRRVLRTLGLVVSLAVLAGAGCSTFFRPFTEPADELRPDVKAAIGLPAARGWAEASRRDYLRRANDHSTLAGLVATGVIPVAGAIAGLAISGTTGNPVTALGVASGTALGLGGWFYSRSSQGAYLEGVRGILCGEAAVDALDLSLPVAKRLAERLGKDADTSLSAMIGKISNAADAVAAARAGVDDRRLVRYASSLLRKAKRTQTQLAAMEKAGLLAQEDVAHAGRTLYHHVENVRVAVSDNIRRGQPELTALTATINGSVPNFNAKYTDWVRLGQAAAADAKGDPPDKDVEAAAASAGAEEKRETAAAEADEKKAVEEIDKATEEAKGALVQQAAADAGLRAAQKALGEAGKANQPKSVRDAAANQIKTQHAALETATRRVEEAKARFESGRALLARAKARQQAAAALAQRRQAARHHLQTAANTLNTALEDARLAIIDVKVAVERVGTNQAERLRGCLDDTLGKLKILPLSAAVQDAGTGDAGEDVTIAIRGGVAPFGVTPKGEAAKALTVGKITDVGDHTEASVHVSDDAATGTYVVVVADRPGTSVVVEIPVKARAPIAVGPADGKGGKLKAEKGASATYSVSGGTTPYTAEAVGDDAKKALTVDQPQPTSVRVTLTDAFTAGTTYQVKVKDKAGQEQTVEVVVDAAAAPRLAAIPPPPAGVPSSSGVPAVAAAQALLKVHGCDPQGIDGILGEHTATAIKCFQKQVGLAETGQLTPEVLKALGLER